MSVPRFAGRDFKLAETTYVIPPLSLGQVRRFLPQLKDVTAADQATQLLLFGDIVHAAITRNYPEFTREQLDDLIDVGNLSPITQAVLGDSGLVLGNGVPVAATAP